MDGSELVAAGTTALVQSMTSTTWETVRQRMAALFGRNRQTVEVELQQTRDELTSNESTPAEVENEWRPKLRRLLKHNPEAARELRKILADLDSVSGPVVNTVGDVSGTVVQAHSISGGVRTIVYHGDHIDQRGARARGNVIGVQHHHEPGGKS
ncbi:MAG TPA: hypothetical protein VKZ89_05920 [Thermobifida alba]|nr:hypothetical protein [Thermobifida alba]